jgi:hypothetical protein
MSKPLNGIIIVEELMGKIWWDSEIIKYLLNKITPTTMPLAFFQEK